MTLILSTISHSSHPNGLYPRWEIIEGEDDDKVEVIFEDEL